MKIIAAIIGMGIGQKHFDAIENYNNSYVKIICEKDKKKLALLKKKYPSKIITNNEDLIFFDNEVNLVSIASYDNFHFSQIMKGLKNDKNLIIEKPMCLSELQLKKIYQLLKIKKKLKITSNLVLRANSLFKQLKKKINKKNLYYLEADYLWGRSSKLYGWRSRINHYSVIYGAAIHMIDIIVWLIGLKPISVNSFGNDIVTKNSVFKKKSFVVMIFEFPNNILVKITGNAPAIYDHYHEIKIFSKNKTLVNSLLGSFEYKRGNLSKIKSNYPDKKNRKKLIHNFIDYLLKKNIKPIINHQDQFDLMSMCFAAEKSLSSKKKIKIKYLIK
tara:strand:- start:2638 stop:3627 length:990 start_codon:yes stop_codon:yes gene_type:complete